MCGFSVHRDGTQLLIPAPLTITKCYDVVFGTAPYFQMSHPVLYQERLEQIADELRSLGERMEELVSAAQQVRDLNDYPALHTLQQQLELLQGKQTQLLVEQSDLMKQQPHSSARCANFFT